MIYMYCCLCGTQTKTTPKCVSIGRVFQCPDCKETRAHVYAKNGGSAWIKVCSKDIKFYNLLEEPK